MQIPFTVRQLEVCSSLRTTRSFRLTAERLGISQASVSNQLKVLETQLGFRLFERMRGRQPVPTQEGTAFLQDLDRFWIAAQTLAGHRRKDATSESAVARVRLITGQGLMDNYIRPQLAPFLAQNPGVVLEMVSQPPDERDRMIFNVEQGGYDCALLHLRAETAVPAGWKSWAVVPGGIYGHRRFAEGTVLPLSPEKISSLPFLLPKSGSVQERQVLASLSRYGINPVHIAGNVQYFDVIAEILERGSAVASLSSAIIRPGARDDVVLLHPIGDWRLVWYRKAGASGAAIDLVERFLIEAVVQNPDYPSID